MSDAKSTTTDSDPIAGPSNTSYRAPTKRILSAAQLQAFQSSQTHEDIVTFIEECNDAVRNVKLSEAGEPSEVGARCGKSTLFDTAADKLASNCQQQPVKSILAILDEVEAIAASTPPVDNSLSRFGNPAFKDFYDKLQAASPRLHHEHIVKWLDLPKEDVDGIVVELTGYFGESWGNRTRVDYGSGMELNFVCWL
jgi:serine/threonine-protein phosphatase 2A activator